MSTPRYVNCTTHNDNGKLIPQYTWDSSKITVEQSLADDTYMLSNVFKGQIISPHIYPLIFDSKCESEEISLRSLEFYREVKENKEKFEKLSLTQRFNFMIGVRDLFVASCRGLLTEEENGLLKAMTNLIDSNDKDIIKKTIQNLSVTPYPTLQNKMVKFVPCNSQAMIDEYFIRNELGLFMVFVDPGQLSYHNFENIINLDSLFTKCQDNFIIQNFKKIEGGDVYTFDMKDASSILLSLDKYNLYAPPFNQLSRGGQRFIFSSEKLSDSLTNTLKECVPNKELINGKFMFVNYVFRYNKFKPNDKKFASHYDTPYHDSKKKHYSKYTLLLYLTPGVADPVLSVDKGKVKIDEIDCSNGIRGVIFDQRYEHEGKSFIEADKIFLRSELVYEYDQNEFTYDEKVSKQFNIACYMNIQSVFHPELERYASECFNYAAESRIALTNNKMEIPDVKLLFKNYCGTEFITNGYDYWFKKDISLEEASSILLIDYFHCKFGYQDSFYWIEKGKIIDSKIKETKEILKLLNEGLDSFGKKKKVSKKKQAHQTTMEIEESKINDTKISKEGGSEHSKDSSEGDEDKEEEEEDVDENEDKSVVASEPDSFTKKKKFPKRKRISLKTTQKMIGMRIRMKMKIAVVAALTQNLTAANIIAGTLILIAIVMLKQVWKKQKGIKKKPSKNLKRNSLLLYLIPK